MGIIDKLRHTRRNAPVSCRFPLDYLSSPTIFGLKDGHLGSVIKIEGVPFITEGPKALGALSHALHQAIIGLDARFICYVTVHRKKEDTAPQDGPTSAFAKRINDKYYARFEEGALYKNHIYLTALVKEGTPSRALRSKCMDDIRPSLIRPQNQAGQIQTLTMMADQLLFSLQKFKPRLLGARDGPCGLDEYYSHSELVQFLSLAPNGGDTEAFNTSTRIPECFLENVRHPNGHFGHDGFSKGAFLGKHIKFQETPAQKARFAAVLSLRKYGRTTAPAMPAPLLGLDAEFIATHSFAPITNRAALRLIKRSRPINAEDRSTSQTRALKQLEEGLKGNLVRMGRHHNTLMLIAPTIEKLECSINGAVEIYAQAGAILARGRTGFDSAAAFIAQVPGDHGRITRAGLITSNNFVHFCAPHHYQTSFEGKGHLGRAIALIEGPCKSPVWFKYHGRKPHRCPSNGHDLILGSHCAGKMAFTAFMDSQMRRREGRSFFLDQGEASKAYILASGRNHYVAIAPEVTGHSLGPLLLHDDTDNRAFLKTWFASLIMREGEKGLPADIMREVNACIDYNFKRPDGPCRQLSHIVKALPPEFSRWPELEHWLKGDGTRADGKYAWIFDNPIDTLDLGFDKVGFDMTWLTDKARPEALAPVLLYLLHRIYCGLNWRVTSIVIDDAFTVFNSPLWTDVLNTAMANYRKRNAHFIFMTQSPQTIISSPTSATILKNVMTKVIFPNPEACRIAYRKHLNLSETEHQCVLKGTAASGVFLYKQKNKAILCKLDLGALEEEVPVLSGNAL